MSSPIERARLHLARQDGEMFVRPLPYFLALEVVDYAEELAKQIAILKQQLNDSEAARRRDAEFDRANLAEIARLQAANKRQRRDLWLLAVLSPIVTLIIRALWSAYAS